MKKNSFILIALLVSLSNLFGQETETNSKYQDVDKMDD